MEHTSFYSIYKKSFKSLKIHRFTSIKYPTKITNWLFRSSLVGLVCWANVAIAHAGKPVSGKSRKFGKENRDQNAVALRLVVCQSVREVSLSAVVSSPAIVFCVSRECHFLPHTFSLSVAWNAATRTRRRRRRRRVSTATMERRLWPIESTAGERRPVG